MRTNRDDIVVNPLTVIRLFNNTFLSVGEEIFKSAKYKVTREAWITSVFLFALGKHEHRDWWLKPNKLDVAPDFYCFTYQVSNKYSAQYTRSVEVFEWRKESKFSFIEALKNKISKLVVPEMTVVCYIRKSGRLESIKSLSEKVKLLKPRLKDIWVVASLAPNEDNFMVAQIYPDPLRIDIAYDELTNQKEQVSFLHPYRGKSEKLIYEPLGKKILLTPDFQFIEGQTP